MLHTMSTGKIKRFYDSHEYCRIFSKGPQNYEK